MARGKQHTDLVVVALLYSIDCLLHLASSIFCCRGSHKETTNSAGPRDNDLLQVSIPRTWIYLNALMKI